MIDIKLNNQLTKIILFSFLLFFSYTGSVYSEILFEDDFDDFTAGWDSALPGRHIMGGTALNPGHNQPGNWTGYVNYGDDTIEVAAGEGRNGSPAFKVGIAPSPANVWDQVGLLKYLGSDGYDEVYIRYYVKYDQNWRWGNGTSGTYFYHKLLRVWQNVTDEEILGTGGSGMGNEFARGAMVLGTADDDYGDFDPFFRGTFLLNGTGDTNSGPVVDMFWFPTDLSNEGGYVEGHFGDIDGAGYWETIQNWHCVELHVKVASSFDAYDGLFEVWIDGIKQKDYNFEYGYPGEGLIPGMPTAQVGNGINYIGLNDNGRGNQHFTEMRYIWFDDFVISTTYIGPISTGAPIGGYSGVNTIPSDQISKTSDGTGIITINFKALDQISGSAIELHSFEYSINNGTSWIAPTNSDSSTALSTNWSSNNYISDQYSTVSGTTQEWTNATEYSFNINTKHADFANLNSHEGNVHFRFSLRNGTTDSVDAVATQTFTLLNMPESAINTLAVN